MAENVAIYEKLAESVKKFPVPYDKSLKKFQEQAQKRTSIGRCGQRSLFCNRQVIIGSFFLTLVVSI